MPAPDTLITVQTELRPWQEHNFPGRQPWEPLLGLVEEVGELSHSYLKRHQRIRIEEDHDARIKDAVADILVYLCDFCNAEKIDLQKTLRETWEKVRQRDWQKNRTGEDKPK